MSLLQSQEREIDIEGTINEFEQKLDRLKVLYEQYFMGIEKREPLVSLKDVVRVMRLLEQQQIRNTGHRFRYRNLVQKFNVFKTYWSRTLRAIELGTYQRDVARMTRNFARKGISMPQIGKVRSVADVERAVVEAVQQKKADTEKVAAIRDEKIGMTTEKVTALGEDGQPLPPPRSRASIGLQPEPSLGPINLDADEDEDTSRSQPSVGPHLPRPRPRPPATPTKAPPQATAISESEMQSLYRRFVKAKEMCGEDTSSIHYDSLVKSISHQLPKIQAQHHGRAVEFQVVIRDGRAILRARPK
jgi:hypothetical protein